jgi:aminotransferase
MTVECDKVGGVNLGQGICDIPTPQAVKRGAIEAIRADRSTYSRFDGVSPLREAVAEKLRTYNGVEYDAENEIVATVGVSGAFACTLQALFNPGDELILFEPYYGYHRNSAEVSGVKPRFFTLDPPDFSIDFEALENFVTPAARGIVVNTPMNPCGKVFSREELGKIAEICKRHDLLCITDEIYEYIVYDREHVSMASLPGMRERTITMSGYSKTFSITGWRVGYAAAPAEMAHAIGLVNDLYYICSPTPLQYGVAEAIRSLDDHYYEAMNSSYRAKREKLCNALDEVGLTPIRPDGAYYVLADISSLGANSAKEGAMKLLNEAGVAGIPGSAFYRDETGETLIRFCYAKRPEDIDEACSRLRRWAENR